MNTEPTQARNDQPVLLIEIGNDRLKMMRATPARRGRVVAANLHIEKIDQGEDNLGKRIASVLGSWPDSRRIPLILSLPRQMVTIRNLELPSTDPGEIDEMIAIQIAKLTPWSRDEVLADYSLRDAGQSGYSQAMLAIAQRTTLRRRFYIAEEAGLEPERLTISSEGVMRWAARRLCAKTQAKEQNECVGILDVDSFYSDFLVLGPGRYAYSRSILAGTNELQKNPEVTLQTLAREVGHSLELAGNENRQAKPERIILSGASLHTDGLADAIREQTGLACETINPFDDIQIEPAAEKGAPAEQREAVSWTALIGMAAEPQSLEFNFIPDTVRMRRELGRCAKSYAKLGVAVMALLLAASLAATVRYTARWEQLEHIREQVRLTAPTAAEIERRQNVTSEAMRYLDAKRSAAGLIASLHPAIPADVVVEGFEFDVERKRLTISGSTPAIRDVRLVVNRLDALPEFNGVREDGATSRDARTGRFNFKIICPMEDES